MAKSQRPVGMDKLSSSDTCPEVCHLFIYYLGLRQVLELSVKTLIDGRNCGFDFSWRKHFIKSLLAHHVLDPIMKSDGKFWSLLFAPRKL